MELQQSDIASLILHLRGEKVMLDSHIAMLYHVETRALKQAVKRNQARFPIDFMFELTQAEVDFLRSQNVISKIIQGGLRYKPIAFTEQGIAMLSAILKSEQAIKVSIAIMRAFVQMRRILEEHKDLKRKLEDLESKYDKQFALVFEAIKQLILYL